MLNHLLIKHAVSWTKNGLADLKEAELPSHERIIMDCEIAILEKHEVEIEKIEIEIVAGSEEWASHRKRRKYACEVKRLSKKIRGNVVKKLFLGPLLYKQR